MNQTTYFWYLPNSPISGKILSKSMAKSVEAVLLFSSLPLKPLQSALIRVHLNCAINCCIIRLNELAAFTDLVFMIGVRIESAKILENSFCEGHQYMMSSIKFAQ